MWNRFANQICDSSQTCCRCRLWYSSSKLHGFRRYFRDGRFVFAGAPLLLIWARCANRYLRGKRFGLCDMARRRICFGNFWNINFVLLGCAIAAVSAFISSIRWWQWWNVVISFSSRTLPPIDASYSNFSVIGGKALLFDLSPIFMLWFEFFSIWNAYAHSFLMMFQLLIHFEQ